MRCAYSGLSERCGRGGKDHDFCSRARSVRRSDERGDRHCCIVRHERLRILRISIDRQDSGNALEHSNDLCDRRCRQAYLIENAWVRVTPQFNALFQHVTLSGWKHKETPIGHKSMKSTQNKSKTSTFMLQADKSSSPNCSITDVTNRGQHFQKRSDHFILGAAV